LRKGWSGIEEARSHRLVGIPEIGATTNKSNERRRFSALFASRRETLGGRQGPQNAVPLATELATDSLLAVEIGCCSLPRIGGLLL
jgi:hypothetical protein